MAKLKVFRTSIGFHDAYVAVPSQKAALDAWGSDGDLFASGMAETVTDEALIKEPLAKPGVVIKRLRATANEHLAEASRTRQPKARAQPAVDTPKPSARAASKPKPKLKPRPDRTPVDKAEEAVARGQARQRAAEKDLADQMTKLARQRDALRTTHRRETEKLEDALDRARSDYEGAMTKWRA